MAFSPSELETEGEHVELTSSNFLFISRSWCPDRTVFQARKYIADSLEEKYTEPVILNLEKTWEESDTHTPLICFLSMGSDPTIQIDALAKKLKLGMTDPLFMKFNITPMLALNITSRPGDS